MEDILDEPCSVGNGTESGDSGDKLANFWFHCSEREPKNLRF